MNKSERSDKDLKKTFVKNDKSTAYDESNPIIVNFRLYAKELDSKHDRYERIVKQSRDITIESKRIIFLLHTIDARKENKEKVLKEANARLTELRDYNFRNIARELNDCDSFQFSRAFSAGLQEFIEAYTYAEYMENKKISDWDNIQSKLMYRLKSPEATAAENQLDTNSEDMCCLIQPTEFMLGLGDLGGEIMRRCINSLVSGDVDTCFRACQFLQCLYTGFASVTFGYIRDFYNKTYTLRQSMLKTEMVCYNIKVRGSEAAKRGSLEDDKHKKYDEGYGDY